MHTERVEGLTKVIAMARPRRTSCATFVLLFLAQYCACSTAQLVADNSTTIIDNMKRAFYAQRSTEQAFAAAPGLIQMLDGLIESSPENSQLLLRGAELNCSFAFTFSYIMSQEWVTILFRKGKEYGLRAIAQEYPALAYALRKGNEQEIATIITGLDSDSLPYLFWTAFCWAGLIDATRSIEHVADLPIVETLFKKCLLINEEFFFASAHIFFGILYAGRTPALGGVPDKGKKHFEKALLLNHGDFLLTKVLFAETYAVNTNNQRLFVQLLQEVLRYDKKEDRKLWLANQVAKKRAIALLKAAPDLFPEWTGDDKPVGEVETDDFLEEDIDLDLDN